MVRGAGVPTLLLVRERGFLLCYWSGCGGFLLCYWSGSGGSYFALGQGEVGGKLVQLCGVRGVLYNGSMPYWSGRRGRLAIGQGTGVDLPLVS